MSDDEWNPERAELRRPGDIDVSAHAQANLQQLFKAAMSGDIGVQTYRRAAHRYRRGERGDER